MRYYKVYAQDVDDCCIPIKEMHEIEAKALVIRILKKYLMRNDIYVNSLQELDAYIYLALDILETENVYSGNRYAVVKCNNGEEPKRPNHLEYTRLF